MSASDDIDPQIWSNRLERAAGLWRKCRACEHRCDVDRFAGEKGFCNAGALPRVYNEVLQVGEEIDLVPTYMVLLSGCDLRCSFCSEGPFVDHPDRGTLLDDAGLRALAGRIERAADPGKDRARPRARFVTFVGGEVSIHLEPLLRLLRILDGRPPAVLVTNLHATPEALDLILESVHAIVADLKFGPDDVCAAQIGAVTPYWSVVTRNVEHAAARRPVYVRHLLMPGHVECCAEPALRWAGALAARLSSVRVNLMTTYQPLHRAARHPVLGRRPDDDELAASLAVATSVIPAGQLLVDGVPAAVA